MNAENAVDPAMAPSTGPSVYVHAGDGPSAVFGPDASSVTSRGPTSRAGFMPQPDTGPVTKMSRPTIEPIRNGAACGGAPSSGSTIALTPNSSAAVEPIYVKNRARVPRNLGL